MNLSSHTATSVLLASSQLLFVHRDLSGLRLYGAIPPSVGLLVNLQNLYLARNGFSGSIPVALGSLGQLQSFDVSNNSLSGTVPAILAALPLTAL